MISIKYRKVYDEFINKYENVHINPWHNISKNEILNIGSKLIRKMDIDSIATFYYFISYLIKKLNGEDDAHTRLQTQNILPINCRLFDKDVYINYPEEYKGYKLTFINNTEIHAVLSEIDEIITYGTLGKKKYELEKALYNSYLLFGLPSFRNSNELIFKIENPSTNEIKSIIFKKDEINNEIKPFDYSKFRYGNPESYSIINNCLIIFHSSLQPIYEEKIINTINEISSKDLTNIERIIVDLRGNLGGNASLNKYLLNFLKKHLDKKIIVLTDYRVFSAGSIALIELLDLGALSIGEEISTPINCYGESQHINIDGFNFTISSKYYNPLNILKLDNKEEFKIRIKKNDLKPYIFKPNIYLSESFNDYINGKDTVLDFTINQNI